MTPEVIKGLFVLMSAILTALLGWIGWLVKNKIDENKSSEDTQTESMILMQQLLDNQRAYLQVLVELYKGVNLALSSDCLQFKAFHKSGLMNGDSEIQINKINKYFESVDDVLEELSSLDSNSDILSKELSKTLNGGN